MKTFKILGYKVGVVRDVEKYAKENNLELLEVSFEKDLADKKKEVIAVDFTGYRPNPVTLNSHYGAHKEAAIKRIIENINKGEVKFADPIKINTEDWFAQRENKTYTEIRLENIKTAAIKDVISTVKNMNFDEVTKGAARKGLSRKKYILFLLKTKYGIYDL